MWIDHHRDVVSECEFLAQRVPTSETLVLHAVTCLQTIAICRCLQNPIHGRPSCIFSWSKYVVELYSFLDNIASYVHAAHCLAILDYEKDAIGSGSNGTTSMASFQ